MEARLQTIESSQGPISIEQLSGTGRGHVFQIQKQRTTLGRGENNQVVIQDESVSRLHAVIEQGEDGQFVIFDNQSRNGIRVNGKKTEAAVLQNGDEILIGSVAFRVSVESPVEDDQVSQLSQVHMTSRRPLNKRLLLYGGVGVVLVAALLMNQSPEGGKSVDAKPGAIGGVPQVQVSDAPTVMGDDPALRGNTVADVTKNPVEAELENLPWADELSSCYQFVSASTFPE
ncbi:FHA domain-containing protein [bacterium]|nr:FHA domain-containing protein [bacterium]